MRWNRFVISLLLMMGAGAWVMADSDIQHLTTDNCQRMDGDDWVTDDSIYTEQAQLSRYDKRVHRYRKHWGALIPTQFVIQNAGNMGFLSAGIGWDYGNRKQWETHLMVGYIPKDKSTRGKMTMTLKENYIPWSIDLKRGWSFEPLEASIYLNTVYGHEFWSRQPRRYPDKYYDFMSTKFRLNVALGQEFTWQIPSERRNRAKSITLFYEFSSCDLYIRSKILESSIPLKDIISLSLGIKLQTL